MSSSGLLHACNYGDVCACGMVNNAVLHYSQTVNHSVPQIVHSLHFHLVDSLLHYAPDFIFNYWIEVGAVKRPQICRDQCSSLMEVDRLARPCYGALSC